MKAWLLLLLIPVSAAQTWHEPADGEILAGTAPLIVEAPDGLWAISTDDPSGSKGNAIRLAGICQPECTFIGFLDTRDLPDGAHELRLIDLATNQVSELRKVHSDSQLDVRRIMVWPDAANPWPLSLNGTGQLRMMGWVANLGTQQETVRLGVEARGLHPVDYWDVRANKHTTEPRWELAPDTSLQLLVTLDVTEAAARGGPVVWHVEAGEEQADWTHQMGGWQDSRTTPAAAPVAVILLALLMFRRTPIG